MRGQKLKNMCLTGVLTAITFVFTAYLHVPSHTGYTHVGDGFIYLAACFLPTPYALFVGAAGAVLADCLTGFALWAPASAVIKALTVLCFSSRTRRILSLRNVVALVPAAVCCVGGYYLYEALITQNFLSPLAGIPGYITQAVCSAGLFVLLGVVLDKLHWKDIWKTGGMER